jgi:hypothetical protein
MKITTLFLFLGVFAFVLGGCKDSSNPAAPAPPGVTSYVGVIAGTGVSGTITISIPTAKRSYGTSATAGDTVEVTATLKINGGATIELAGFYVKSTGELYLTGGGYLFEGVVNGGKISGTFTYSGGSGFFNCDEGNASNIKTYCGTYHDNAPGTGSGAFNITRNGTSLVVIVYPSDAGGQAFMTTGSINASNEITIFNPDNTAIVVATGTLNPTTNAVSGSYAGDPGGTWSGSLCN